MYIIQKAEPQKGSILHRLLKWPVKRNAIIEIRNLLSSNQNNFLKVEFDQLAKIADRHHVNLKKDFRKERLEIYCEVMEHFLSNMHLDDLELRQLNHLQILLLLDDRSCRRALESFSAKTYAEKVKGFVKDGKIDPEEQKKIDFMRKNLFISEELADKLFEEEAGKILLALFEQITEDRRLSPTEEAEFKMVAKSLGAAVEMSGQTIEQLNRFRLYWKIENGQLPEIVSDINLHKSERLHFKTECQWLEQKTVTKRVNYAGPTARIKLAKGIYYRAGSLKVGKTTKDILAKIDSGRLYITSKRIIFMGAKGNKNIRINEILEIVPYSNGIQIEKSRGKSPFLDFTKQVDVGSMILASLMERND